MNPGLADEFWLRTRSGIAGEDSATEWVKEFEHLGMDLQLVHPRHGSVLHWAFHQQWSSLAIYLMKQGVSPLLEGKYHEIPAQAWNNTYESKGSQEGRIVSDDQNGLKLDASACVAMFDYEPEQRWREHFANDSRFVEDYLVYALPHFWLPSEKTFDSDALKVLSFLVEWAPEENVKDALPALNSSWMSEREECLIEHEDRIRRALVKKELVKNVKPVVGQSSLGFPPLGPVRF